jgi:hypothetical protein
MDDNNNSTPPSSDSLPAGTTDPIPGIPEPFDVKTSNDQYHGPPAIPPQPQTPVQIPATGQPSGQTTPPATETPATPPPSEPKSDTTPQTPPSKTFPPGPFNDIPGDKSSDLA